MLPDGTSVSAKGIRNAIWSCTNCRQQVDADPESYPTVTLVAWKTEHELRVSGLVGLDQSLLRLGSARKFHDVAMELLTWLDGHRFMYFDDSCEFRSQVLEVLLALREKLRGLRASLTSEDDDLYPVASSIEGSVLSFFDSLHDVDLRTVKVNSCDKQFNRFCARLRILREDIKNAVRDIAARERFTFRNIAL